LRAGTGVEAVRFVLRRETRAAHESLDGHPALAALMNGTMDTDGYRRLMVLFHGFYASHDRMIERACQDHSLSRFGFVYARRTEILASDLAALAVQPPSILEDTSSNTLPPIGSAASLGGVLYVLEGSMLGGAVLCRAAEKLLGKDGGLGIGYWQWCRAAGGERWAMTCDMLENLAADSAATQEMLTGADAAFATFASWFADWQSNPQETDRIREH
jgi:heme oxygenase (biliverdin-IX-beta and delta-forming)